jgi:HD-GYP domain-containing protein (c-di-GMP phosphodiesterase class II)
MTKVLIVEENVKIESFMFLNLKVYLELVPMPKKDVEKAVETLKENPDISLIVARVHNQKEKSASIIAEYLEENNLKIPILGIGPFHDSSSGIFTDIIFTPVDVKALLKSSAKILNVTPGAMAKLDVGEYYVIPIKYILTIKDTPVDIFIKNGEEYEEVLNGEEEAIDLKVIEGLLHKGVTDIYVRSTERLKLCNHLTDQIISTLPPQTLKVEDNAYKQIITIEELTNAVRSTGVSDMTIKQAEKGLKEVQAMGNRFPELGKLLKVLTSSGSSYRLQHVQIVTYLCMHVLKHTEWRKKHHEEKLAMACFFHDVLLPHDYMCTIKDDKELFMSDLKEEQKKIVKEHAHKAALVMEQNPKTPGEVATIIRQHHGQINGIGYSKSFNMNLTRLSCIFIVAEDYADKIIEAAGEKPNKIKIMNYLGRKYPTTRFRNILDMLDQIML